jgi:hypothetical protein
VRLTIGTSVVFDKNRTDLRRALVEETTDLSLPILPQKTSFHIETEETRGNKWREKQAKKKLWGSRGRGTAELGIEGGRVDAG